MYINLNITNCPNNIEAREHEVVEPCSIETLENWNLVTIEAKEQLKPWNLETFGTMEHVHN